MAEDRSTLRMAAVGALSTLHEVELVTMTDVIINYVFLFNDNGSSSLLETDWQQAPGREVLDNLELFEVWTREGPDAEWTLEDVERETPSHVKLVIKANGRFWPELVMQVQQ